MSNAPLLYSKTHEFLQLTRPLWTCYFWAFVPRIHIARAVEILLVQLTMDAALAALPATIWAQVFYANYAAGTHAHLDTIVFNRMASPINPFKRYELSYFLSCCELREVLDSVAAHLHTLPDDHITHLLRQKMHLYCQQ